MSITINDVQSFIDQNKENRDVQNYVSGFVTADRVSAFLNTEDGKKILQPQLDSYHAKSLESWKKNNLSRLVDEETNKRHPAETEDQKRLKKIEADNLALQTQLTRGRLKDAYLLLAQKDSFPIELVDFAIAEDEDTTNANYARLKSTFDKALDAKVNEKFKGSGRTPASKSSEQNKGGGMNAFIRGSAGY